MLLSFKNALKFAFSSVNWLTSFIWSIVNIVIFLSFVSFIKSHFMLIMRAFMGNKKAVDTIVVFLKSFAVGYILYGLAFCALLSYFLIVAKRMVYNQPVHISLSFFIKKCVVLVPIFVVYAFFLIAYPVFCIRFQLPKSLLILGVIFVSYLFTAFLISYMHHFNWDSLKRLFIPALCEPFLILTAWFYIILYGVTFYFSTKYLILVTKKILGELMPLILPCQSLTAILTLVLLSIPVRLFVKAISRRAKIICAGTLVYMIPSVVLYSLLQDFGDMNFLMFIVVFQILWYEWLFIQVLNNSSWLFMSHLFAESSLHLAEAHDGNQVN